MSDLAASLPFVPAGPTREALDAERRTLLGDSRSVDRLDAAGMARFVAVCHALRLLAYAAGTLAPRASGRPRVRALDIADI